MIRINKNYVIDSGAYDYTLYRDMHSKDKKDKPIYSFVGYYSSVRACVTAAMKDTVKNKLSRKDEITLNEAVRIIQDAEQHFENLLTEQMGEN